MRGRNIEEAVYSIEFIAVEVYKHRVVWVSKFPGCLKIRVTNYSIENSLLSKDLFNTFQKSEEKRSAYYRKNIEKDSLCRRSSIHQLLVKHHK